MIPRLILAILFALVARFVAHAVEPPVVAGEDLARHEGHTVAIVGTVRAVQANGNAARVTIADGTSSVEAWMSRANPPAPGSLVTVEGRATTGRAGPVLYDARVRDVHETGPIEPEALAGAGCLLEGADVAIHGLAAPDAIAWGAASVPARWPGPAPTGELTAWGRLVPDPQRPGLSLEVHRWTPSSPAHSAG